MIYCPDSGSDRPWHYARVLDIYHMRAHLGDEGDYETYTFLWVRWLETDTTWAHGPAVRRLERLQYVNAEEEVAGAFVDGAFGMVNPAHVIRGCYLAPAVHRGHDKNGLVPSYAHDFVEGRDWRYYYVVM
jgi:hypothetical protein